MKSLLDLTGQCALVTGASSGIGAATAVTLAELGARVAIGYHHNQSGAGQTRDRIASAGGTAVAILADVRHADGVKALVDDAHPAAWPARHSYQQCRLADQAAHPARITDEHLDAVYALNVKSAVLAAQAVAASMIERKRGAIVNVVSIAGHNGGGPGAGAYASAKAALTCYTKSMAKELAPHGVRVNAVAPGVIATPFHDTFSTPEMLKAFVAAIPLGRLGTPEECANVIAFLASPAASFVLGETIDIDGGQLMR